jgi:tryptophan 2,3-dioxygenase
VSRSGFTADTREDRVDAIVEILSYPEKHADLFNMQDLLIEHDENIALWRYHHVLMVERMLGMKRGTGGSEGAGYLMKTIGIKFFPEIWEARTHLKVAPK